MNGASENEANAIRRRRIIAIVCGLVCLLFLQCSYSCYVHYFFAGEYYGPFLYSDHWGVPEIEKKAGMNAVYTSPDFGWDGQFYYRQSIDPFLTGEGGKFSDNASYRYQRNGVSMLAWLVAWVLGQQPTPAAIYQFVQFAMLSAGLGYLVDWLLENRLSPIYAVGWLFTSGLWSLFHGLPDTASDAVFVFSILSLFRRNLWVYLATTSFLLLTRESYSVFAASIFVLTFMRVIEWPKFTRYRATFLTMLPGIVVLAWAAYVAWKLNLPILHGSRNAPFGNLVDWPFHAFFTKIVKQWGHGEQRELNHKIVCALTLVVVLIYSIIYARKLPGLGATIPYTILISMTGSQIWENSGGYPKALGTIVLVAIFLLPQNYTHVLKLLILLHLILGIQMFQHYNVKYQAFLHKDILAATKQFPAKKSEIKPGAENELFKNLTYSVVCEPIPSSVPPYHGVFEKYHRAPRIYHVKLTNNSGVDWKPATHGTNGRLQLAYRLSDGKGRVLADLRKLIETEVKAGETIDYAIALPIAATVNEISVVVGVTQNDYTWFLEEQGGTPFRETAIRRYEFR